MNWPLFQREAKLAPFDFQMIDLHQKFKLNFDNLLLRIIIFFIDQLASYSLYVRKPQRNQIRGDVNPSEQEHADEGGQARAAVAKHVDDNL